jgi:hypothetical protein
MKLNTPKKKVWVTGMFGLKTRIVRELKHDDFTIVVKETKKGKFLAQYGNSLWFDFRLKSVTTEEHSTIEDAIEELKEIAIHKAVYFASMKNVMENLDR